MNIALNLNNEQDNKIKKILPYSKTKISYWLENDSRSIEEKALIMFFGGRNRDNICKLLNISHKEFRTWIFNYYEKISIAKKSKKINQIYEKPNNYSEWTSNIIYDFWEQLRHKNKYINKAR